MPAPAPVLSLALLLMLPGGASPAAAIRLAPPIGQLLCAEPDAAVRCQALDALTEWQGGDCGMNFFTMRVPRDDAEGIAALVLQDGDPRVRVRAIKLSLALDLSPQTLARIDRETDALLRHPDREVRRDVLSFLVAVPQAVITFHDDYRVRNLALRAIAAIDGFADDEDPEARELADQLRSWISMLPAEYGTIHDRMYLPSAPSDDDRCRQIHEWSRWVRADSAASIAAMLEVPSPRVRIEALGALGRLGAVEHHVSVAGMLRDPDRDVRGAAVHALGAMGTPGETRSLVRRALADPEPIVRRQAMTALEHGGDWKDFAAVAALLRDPDDETRGHAVEVVAQMGGPARIDLLASLRFDRSDIVRERAANLIRLAGHPMARAWFTEMLGHESPAVRDTARRQLDLMAERPAPRFGD